MTKALYIKEDGQIGQDVEIISNYGDGGYLIEFHNGDRKLVSVAHLDLKYFAEENKKYNGPIPDVSVFDALPNALNATRWIPIPENVEKNVDSVENYTPKIFEYTPEEVEEMVTEAEMDTEYILLQKEKAELEGKLEGIRARSLEKGKANKRLSDHNDLLDRTNKELDRENQLVIQENRELIAKLNDAEDRLAKAGMDLTEIARLNEYHRGEVDKGNQFREKLKQTITDLHEEIAQVKNEKEEAVRHAITVERRAGRAEAMVDFMLAATMQKTNFENR